MSTAQRKSAIPRPESVPDLRDALTAGQREAVRRAAQAERVTVKCVGSGVRCVTDGEAHLGTFIDKHAAHEAADDHEHSAVVSDQEWRYPVVCLDSACDESWIVESASSAGERSWQHWRDEGHIAIWDRAPELVEAIEGGAA
jgi:hypothetical protein